MHLVLYFSSTYIAMAKTLVESLQRFENDLVVHAMTADKKSAEFAENSGFDSIELHQIQELINDPHRDEKTFAERLFTAGPRFLSEVLDKLPDGERVIYANSDIFFFKDPSLIWSEHPPFDVLLFPHHFSTVNRLRLQKYGQFNAGALAMVSSLKSREIVRSWAEQTAAWCWDRAEDGKYADQKYLETFHGFGSQVVASEDQRFNLGPWTNATESLVYEQCVFYHFHSARDVGDYWLLPHLQYLKLPTERERSMYQAYLQELFSVSQGDGVPGPRSNRSPLQVALMRFSAVLRPFGLLVPKPKHIS